MSNYRHHSDVVNNIIDDDYMEEAATTCHACYGTGLDRHVDADCMVCWGEGSLLITSETQSDSES